MARLFAALLALVVSSAVVAADPCTDLGESLGCSACKLFIEKVFDEVARAPSALVNEGSSTKNLWHEGQKKKAPKVPSVAKMYTQRIKEVYKEHAPEKVSGVTELVNRSKGKEHSLYSRICTKYGVAPKAEYDGTPPPATQDESTMWKFPAAEEALAATVASANNGKTQWAKSGTPGKELYVDFNKAMNGGNMENLSMGGKVGEDLEGCFSYLASEHAAVIADAVSASAKPFSSGLHKTFCPGAGMCPPKKKKTEL